MYKLATVRIVHYTSHRCFVMIDVYGVCLMK